jgi:hypothetical protein
MPAFAGVTGLNFLGIARHFRRQGTQFQKSFWFFFFRKRTAFFL